LHLLPRPVLGLLGLEAGALGLLAGAAALVLGAAGLLLPFLLGPAHLLLGSAPGLAVGEAGEVAGEDVVVGVRAGGTSLAGRGAHLAAQVARRPAAVRLELGRQFGDRRAALQFQVGQFATAAGQLGAARVGDGVHLAAALHGVGDQALRLQLGQPGVDRA